MLELAGEIGADDVPELIALNKKVDIDGGAPEKVAQDWLTSKGLA